MRSAHGSPVPISRRGSPEGAGWPVRSARTRLAPATAGTGGLADRRGRPGCGGGTGRSAAGCSWCRTASDAGKSVITAALCRWLARQGLPVAPSRRRTWRSTRRSPPTGREIGRAQAMQAAACGIEPEAAINPVLIKPRQPPQPGAADGRGGRDPPRRPSQELFAGCARPCRALDELRGAYDVVICEGAGSPAEINLRAGDYVEHGPRPRGRAAHHRRG